MSEKTPTIEVQAPAPAPEAPAKLTVEDAQKQGWSPDEIKKGKERGMLAEEAAPAPKPAAPAPAPEAGEEPAEGAEEGAEGGAPPKPAPKPVPKSGIPEMPELSPEQEEFIKANFPQGHPLRGLYFRMKGERSSRQRVERELSGEITKLKAQLELLMKGGAVAEPEVPAEGEVEDDKPLTRKDLEDYFKRQAEQQNGKTKEQQETIARVKAAQNEQEEVAKEIYGAEEFESSMRLTADLLQNAETFFAGDRKTLAKVAKLVKDLQIASAYADEVDPHEGYTAADIAMEIAKMHPKYGEAPSADPNPDAPKGGPKGRGLSPEQLRRAEQNGRRKSSAAIPDGSGKRTIAVKDVGAAELNAMNVKERMEFKKNYPDRYAEIISGR